MFMLRRSVSTASATPGYWTLTATSRAVARARAVDLADRRRGDRLASNSAKTSRDRPAELGAQQLLQLRRTGPVGACVAQRGERLLELLALVLGHEVEVDRREDLADLHRRALHLPELLDELVGDRDRVVALASPPRRPSTRSGRSGRCGRSAAWASVQGTARG